MFCLFKKDDSSISILIFSFIYIYTFILFLWWGRGGSTARQDYFTYFEPNQSLGGAKMRDPEKKHMANRKQNLACLPI